MTSQFVIFIKQITGCPNKFQTAAIAPVLGCAVGWLIPHRVRPLGPPIQQYEWLPPGPSLGKYFLKTSNFVSMETPKILYLLQRTAKFKAEYRMVYPMAAIVYLWKMNVGKWVFQTNNIFSFQWKQKNLVYT